VRGELVEGAMAAYVLLEPTPSAAGGAAYWAGIGELATTVVMAVSYGGPDEEGREGQVDYRSVAGCFRPSPLHCASRAAAAVGGGGVGDCGLRTADCKLQTAVTGRAAVLRGGGGRVQG